MCIKCCALGVYIQVFQLVFINVLSLCYVQFAAKMPLFAWFARFAWVARFARVSRFGRLAFEKDNSTVSLDHIQWPGRIKAGH